MSDFNPENLLESALLSANKGRLGPELLLGILISSDIVIPSTHEANSDGSGLQPLFFEKEGLGMVSAFTSFGRIGNLSKQAPYALVLKGIDLLRRLPPEYGVVVNPGNKVGFELKPEGVRKLLHEIVDPE